MGKTSESVRGAARLTGGTGVSVQAAKELGLRGEDMDLVTGLRVEQMWNRMLRFSEDAKKGPAAFAEKRPARFQGR